MGGGGLFWIKEALRLTLTFRSHVRGPLSVLADSFMSWDMRSQYPISLHTPISVCFCGSGAASVLYKATGTCGWDYKGSPCRAIETISAYGSWAKLCWFRVRVYFHAASVSMSASVFVSMSMSMSLVDSQGPYEVVRKLKGSLTWVGITVVKSHRNLGASPFDKGLSTDTAFSQIHLYGPSLQVRDRGLGGGGGGLYLVQKSPWRGGPGPILLQTSPSPSPKPFPSLWNNICLKRSVGAGKSSSMSCIDRLCLSSALSYCAFFMLLFHL